MRTRIVIILLSALFCAASVSAQINPDKFTLTVEGSALHIQHINAYYDCQQTGFTYEVTAYQQSLWVEEIENPEGGLSDCDCHYDLGVTLLNVQPGEWEVDIFWLDDALGDWNMKSLFVAISDIGQTDPLAVGAITRSDCYPGTIANRSRDWGRLKTLYR